MKHFTMILAGALLMGACSKKEDDPKPNNPPAPVANSYTINGDGHSNKVVDFNTPLEAKGVLTVSANNTSLYIKQANGSDTTTMTISFNGKVPWEYNFGGTNGMSVGFKNPNSSTFYASKSGNGTIVVESYGAVGEHIKGTFSGTFFNPFTSATVTINNGRFDVIRAADKP